MGYRFRMEKLLRLKRLAEEESVRRLGQRMQGERDCLCRAQALESGCDELLRELQQPLDGVERALVLELLDRLSRQLQQTLQELARAREDVERQRVEARRRVCDRQAFERIEEEDRERHRQMQRRVDRRRQDETSRAAGLALWKIAEVENE